MKTRRIFAIVIRYLFVMRHNIDRYTDAFYWPTVDLLLWGLTSAYFESSVAGAPRVVLVVASGIVFWIVVWRGQYEISVNALEELWDKNLVNLFVSPLSFSEWLAGLLTMSVLKAIPSVLFGAIMSYVLYRVQLFEYGFALIPLLVLLIMTGWWAGFFVTGLLLRYGSKVQSFAWTLIMVISPFSAIYYPLSVLPDWAQMIAKVVPTSYVFEAARQVLANGTLPTQQLLIALALNSLYLAAGCWYLYRSYQKVLHKGLVKIH